MTGPLIELRGAGLEFLQYDSFGRSFKRRLFPFGTKRPSSDTGTAVAHIPGLEKIDLIIEQGDRLALLGANASGRSTLVRVIAGYLAPEKGTVVRRADAATAMDYGVALDPASTVRDTARLYSVLHGYEWRRSGAFADDVIAFARMTEVSDQPARQLPPALKNRLAISIALHLEPRLLLFDDVFEAVEPDFSRRVVDFIETEVPQSTALVVVSRQRWLMEALCHEAIYLERGTVLERGAVTEIADRHAPHQLI